MNKISLIIFIILSNCLFSSLVWAQCGSYSAIPSQPACPASGTSLSSSAGAIGLTTGTSYKLASSSITISGDINAASNTKIYICSGQTLSISGNLNNDGLIIYVLSGGTLSMTNLSAAINAGTTIYVYGSMAATSNLNMNSTSSIQVASTGTLSVSSKLTIQGSSVLASEGNVNIATLDKNGGTSVCMNSNGCIRFTPGTLNDRTFNNTSGTGYLFYNSTTCPSSNLTLSSSTKVCYKGTTTCTAGRFGSATVTYSCNPSPATCAGVIALPIQLVFFKATPTSEGVKLIWGINKSWDSDYFVIERSKNGIDWEEVGTMPSVPNTNQYSEFSLYDKKPYSGLSYYRLSEVDVAGQKTIYAHAFVEIENTFKGFSMYPNPSNGELNVNIFGEGNSYDFVLYDITGRKIHQSTLSQGLNVLSYLTSESGVYVAKLKWGTEVFTQKLVIQ